jgi:hypothetical protein
LTSDPALAAPAVYFPHETVNKDTVSFKRPGTCSWFGVDLLRDTYVKAYATPLERFLRLMHHTRGWVFGKFTLIPGALNGYLQYHQGYGDSVKWEGDFDVTMFACDTGDGRPAELRYAHSGDWSSLRRLFTEWSEGVTCAEVKLKRALCTQGGLCTNPA